MKVLLVEDEKNLGEYIKKGLTEAGFIVDHHMTGLDGYHALMTEDFSVVVMDVMLPDVSGFELIQRYRAAGKHTPVLFLTAKDDLSDRIKGIEIGGDDYLTKPYATKELIARIRSTLRRHEEPKIVADPSFNIGDLAIYPDRHEVRVGDEVVDLTKKEFDLLLFLAKNKNRVLKREEVLEKVWGYGYAGKTNIVDVYVRYLRSKIDEKVGKKYIHTVRGIGYVARD